MGKIKEKCNCEEPECGGYRYVDGPTKHPNKTMFNLQEYLEKTEKEFDGKWNLWHETTEQRNAVKSFLHSAIENAVKETLEDAEKALTWDWDKNIDENGRNSHWELENAIRIIQALKNNKE